MVDWLEWDSNHFGFSVAKIIGAKLNQNKLTEILKYCDKHNIRLLEYACDCHDKRSVELAELYKFNFVDIRLTFELDLSKFSQVLSISSDLVFEMAIIEDIPELQNISKNIYELSRYYFDTNFPEDKVESFYKNWISKAVTGEFDHHACIIRSSISGEIFAFCTIRYEENNIGRLALVGVLPSKRGQGLGTLVVNKSLNYLKQNSVNKVEIVTQGRNYSAQRLYQRMGFLTKKTELWYHKWFS